MSKWISVKDKMPEKDGDYLVYTIGGMMVVMGFTRDLRNLDMFKFRHKKSGWYDHDSEYGFFERDDIMYYMPLPEPPEKEDKPNGQEA